MICCVPTAGRRGVEDVRGLQAHQIIASPVAVQVGSKPVGVAEPGTLEFVADAARVGEQGWSIWL